MNTLAQLPIAEAELGVVFDRQQPHEHNDGAFAAWEAPLVWHHQASYLAIDEKFNRQKALHFAFEQRVPEAVWSKGWHIWYDNAVLLREQPPADCVIEATLALEEQTAGFGGDNVDHVRPWSGIVARLQDLRRYYFLTLEFPDAVVLYRRDDRQWVKVAHRQTTIDVWAPYRLRLECRGNEFRAWLDGEFLFRAADYAYEAGWAGVRATCTSFVTSLGVAGAPPSREEHGAGTLEGRAPASPLPSPPASPRDGTPSGLPKPRIVADLDLSAHGALSCKGKKSPPGMTDERYQAEILVLGETLVVRVHGRDATHVCVDLAGKLIWQASLPGVDHLVKLGPDLVGVGKEELVVVDGRTGQVLRRAPAPRTPGGKAIAAGNCPNVTADLDGTGAKQCFFLSVGANDAMLWAYGSDLKPRWYVEAPSGGGHGDHVSVCDVDGDGRDEVFHGCALWNHKGKMLWRQDEVIRRLKCPNGGHVDASVMGFFDGPSAPPTVHMASSSAGHNVADARTGELLVSHPQGHVQACTTGRVVPGAPGAQVIASNRWGSYGVTAIYAGDGRRLARFQPGFVCQAAKPIQWIPDGHQHLLVVDGIGWRGIYDHTGRRLVDLDPFVPYDDAHRQRYDRVQAWRLPDGLLLRRGARLRVLSRPVRVHSRF